MRALDIIDVNFWIMSISVVSNTTYIYEKLLHVIVVSCTRVICLICTPKLEGH